MACQHVTASPSHFENGYCAVTSWARPVHFAIERLITRHYPIEIVICDDARARPDAERAPAVIAEGNHALPPLRERLRIARRHDDPVSPRILAASPVSVATHGTPHAIASARTFGKPSPKAELKVAMSSAG